MQAFFIIFLRRCGNGVYYYCTVCGIKRLHGAVCKKIL